MPSRFLDTGSRTPKKNKLSTSRARPRLGRAPCTLFMQHDVFASELQRSRVVDRLASSRASLVWLIASAGFGKSTIARQFADRFPTRTICDCSDTRDVVDFAGRVIEALSQGDEKLRASLTQWRLSGTRDVDQWSDMALSTWAAQSGESIYTFENAEHLAGRPKALELFKRLLGHHRRGQVVVVCTRSRLDGDYIRGISPHEVIRLDSAELAFDRDEIRQFFPPGALTPSQDDRIYRATRGWPIGVLLLARFAREGKLADALAELESVATDGIEEYLINEVLSSLTTREYTVMQAVAAIPNVTVDDLTSVEREWLAEAWPSILRRLPFVAVRSGEIDVHPLVAATVRRRNPDACAAILRSAAAGNLQNGRSSRAALLFLAIGDVEAAAAAIESEGVLYLFNPSPAYARVVQALDTATLIRHPSLWAASTPCRVPRLDKQQWLDEAALVWNGLSPDVPDLVRLAVAAAYANALANVGRYPEAAAALDLALDMLSSPLSDPERFIEGMLRAAIHARQGRYGEASLVWERIRPYCTSQSSMALLLSEVDVRIARVRSDRALERGVLDHAIIIANASGLAMAVCYMYMEAAFGAWLAGEDKNFVRYVDELERVHVSSIRPAIDVFLACCRGPLDAIEPSVEHPRHRCYALLIAAARATGERRKALAESAVTSADLCAENLLQVITRVARAAIQGEKRTSFLAEAQDFAAKSDLKELLFAVDSLRKGAEPQGMLAHLVRRFTSEAIESEPSIRVEVLNDRALLDGREVHLTDRESELLTMLAASPRELPSEELSDALWPDGDKESRDTGLRVYVNRLRTKLGAKRAIISSGGRYRLSEKVSVDVVEIEARVQSMYRSDLLTPTDIETLEGDFKALCSPRPPATLVWRWFGPKVEHYQQLARDIGMRLARETGDRTEHGMLYARMLLQSDPCDEAACEMAIRAHLANGDRAGAAIEFRRFRETLSRELGITPPPELEALVHSANTSPAMRA
jgi:DNA-binding SARP family transcriptional activator/tetratricopeptide (TPR) repeat protein